MTAVLDAVGAFDERLEKVAPCGEDAHHDTESEPSGERERFANEIECADSGGEAEGESAEEAFPRLFGRQARKEGVTAKHRSDAICAGVVEPYHGEHGKDYLPSSLLAAQQTEHHQRYGDVEYRQYRF